MLRRAEPSVDLGLDPATIRHFAELARQIATHEEIGGDNPHEIEFDDTRLEDRHAHQGLAEEDSDDLTEEELRELINDLNDDEAAHLLTVFWIGRGDFDAGDFDEALEAAAERPRKKLASYLLAAPMLADHLEAGLDTLGV
ncbi:MAG: DUF3775 domain-containing protein [Hyphomicrobiaceae bacterium]|nr:DUF3775 domain-containing protein [Hyphomicrobiaceae bacterium]